VGTGFSPWRPCSCFAGCATFARRGPAPAHQGHGRFRPDSALGKIALASQPDPDLSGFRLMPGGDFAFDTRIQLARRAQRSLDVQYYQIENDETGRYLLRTLRDAAQRGVRVRLLMDDLYTSGEDELLLAWPPRRTSSCASSTRSRPGAAACSSASPPRCSTSSGSTAACTTSCSSPTARWRWRGAETSATSTSRAPRAKTFSTSTPSSPVR
jgi:hypothetical protein